MLAAVGITVTPEGKAWAAATLAAADAERSPERRVALRARLNLPLSDAA